MQERRPGHHHRRLQLRSGQLPRARGSGSLYLGIKAVVVKSFARIHVANLINAGILPLTFRNEADYDRISEGDVLSLPDIRRRVAEGADVLLKNETTGEEFILHSGFTKRQIDMLLAGGLLDYTRNQHQN